MYEFLTNNYFGKERKVFPFISLYCNGQIMNLPYADDTGERISLESSESKKEVTLYRYQQNQIEITIRLTWYCEANAASWEMSVRNISNEQSPQLSGINVLDMKIPMDITAYLSFEGINGDQCGDRSFAPFQKDFNCGMCMRTMPNGGKSSHDAFPFFDLVTEDDILICGIGWSGTWYYEISRDETGLSVKAGLPEADFYLLPGEEIRLPQILLKMHKGNRNEGHHTFRKLMLTEFSPSDDIQLPITLQTFDRYTYDTPLWNSEMAQKQVIDCITAVGNMDTYWLDAAWFIGGFPKGVGNYRYREGFPNGLLPVTEYAHENGLRVMVWFEPERVEEDTDVYREHPEFLLKRSATGVTGANTSLLLNLADEQVVSWLCRKIGDMIEQLGIDIYRHDFNIDPKRFWEEHDTANRKGITEIRYINGLYKFWDTLLERFPGLLIDNCASGGNRMDLAACRRSVFCWRSDTGCFPTTAETPSSLWNQNQCLALMRYIPYQAIAVWDERAYDVRSAASNGLAMNFDILSEGKDLSVISRLAEECKRYSTYWNGDFYPLADAGLETNRWAGWQLDLPEKKRGIAYLFRRQSAEAEMTLRLKGLYENGWYEIKRIDEQQNEQSIFLDGKTLASGYCVSIEQPCSSLILEYILQ